MKNSFKVSYVTTLPKEGNAPRVTITGNMPHTYIVSFHESTSDGWKVIRSEECRTNQTIVGGLKQWFTNWGIMIKDEYGNTVFSDCFDPRGKVVFIKLDAWALGDTIAWIPYVEMFRQMHECRVICSTFHNDLLSESFPDIMFAKPNTQISNVYAQFYVGASNDENPYYSPIKVNEHPLQDVASRILGLKPMLIRPDLTAKYAHISSRINGKYVTLSEYGSAENKHWKAENGWQGVVDYLNGKGYKVVVISKEKTSLTGIIDKSGDISLDDRCVDIMYANMHLGVSSGLSWLAWALGTHVVMISDVTPNWHEFNTGVTRINANVLESVNYLAEGQTSLEEVIKKLVELGVE
jgi:autotransporter strand-loop-strand O-heptosyltransferase